MNYLNMAIAATTCAFVLTAEAGAPKRICENKKALTRGYLSLIRA